MKIQILGALCAFSLLIPAAACTNCHSAPKTAVAKVPANAAKVKLSFPKIHCEGCANGIKTTISKLPGVYKLDVDIKDKTATVFYDAKKVTPAKMLAATKKIGFEGKVVPTKPAKKAA